MPLRPPSSPRRDPKPTSHSHPRNMPTLQITPDALDLLQNVADMLAKSRKMVIITGAGISTNSGIPDFRSENGLYSLIQDQFERAEANVNASIKRDSDEDRETNPSLPPTTTTTASASMTPSDICRRPIKRRRMAGLDKITSSASSLSEVLSPDQPSQPILEDPLSADMSPAPYLARRNLAQGRVVAVVPVDSPRRVTRSQATVLRPTLPRHLTQNSIDSSTSHDSVFSDHPPSCDSSQTDTSALVDTGQVTSHTRTNTPRRLISHLTTTGSSPLSSPPPDLFDPYENANSSTDSSSHEDSDYSDTTESNDTQQSSDFFSSQASSSNLRNMKGRDLFDCNIWADPLKTSVFYRFATSLRQRVKDVEPTITHRFIAQMRDVGKLARVYTQNIDEIEKKIGLSTDLKHGFGNKKRKPVKQQLSDLEKEEVAQSTEVVSTVGAMDTVQLSQKSEDVASALSKPHASLSPEKGVECVFLHGSLHSLRCFVCGKLCNWDEDGRESRTLSGEQPECPHCAGATAARQEKGKRALGIGKLRPDIVLYGEEHPQSDLISPIVQHDLAAGPDLLLVLGTSLRVHGLKVMVKEFAKAVHKKGGKVIFINFTKPSESVWGDVLDYWIDWDCDAWVEDLKTRKPLLWLTADERLEMDRQRRETLAERKREALKKRESLNEKKRDSLGDMRRPLPEQSKTRPPPKNPVAMRNDYHCGAYIVWDIFQTLAKIGDRPFDNLGYTPSASLPNATSPSNPTPKSNDSNVECAHKPGNSSQMPPDVQRRNRKPLPRRAPSRGQGPHRQPRFGGSISTPGEPSNPSELAFGAVVGTACEGPRLGEESTMPSHTDKPPVKKKRARKSAPATLEANMDVNQKRKPTNERHIGKDRYMQAARELARSRKTPTPGHPAIANRLPATPGHPSPCYEPHELGLRPRQATVGDSSRRHSASFPFQPCLLPPLPDPPGLQYSVSTHNSLPIQAPGAEGPMELPPFNKNWERHVDWERLPPLAKAVPVEIAPLVGPTSPLTENRPGLSKSNYSYTWHHSTQPIYNDPLVGISRQATAHKPQWHVESNDENTPSPSDQLRMEAANQLWQLRGRG
ncbi:DHS-like NAD/FAD-binding domain-containing protein [Xylaria grammica]|nr:DHS-like NAD/FAD-binding domain-containing protein [Xylaria grammica]